MKAAVKRKKGILIITAGFLACWMMFANVCFGLLQIPEPTARPDEQSVAWDLSPVVHTAQSAPSTYFPTSLGPDTSDGKDPKNEVQKQVQDLFTCKNQFDREQLDEEICLIQQALLDSEQRPFISLFVLQHSWRNHLS